MIGAAHQRVPAFPRYAGRDAAAARAMLARDMGVVVSARPGLRRDVRGLPIVPGWCAQVSALRPATVGAWRLAWWLRATRTRHAAFERMCCMGPGSIIRLLDGEMVPVDICASLIAQHTEGAVRVGDWSLPCAAGWFDLPESRAGAGRGHG